MLTINPDGVSVRGCEIIYAPRGQAGEYAPLSTNPYRGCGHACAYCYVPRVIHIDRKEFDAGAFERPGYPEKFLKDAKKYQALGLTGQVMLSFTTDPYPPPLNTIASAATFHGTTRWVLEQLQEHGLAFCTLTKGGSRALRDLELFRPTRDAFATTLTSLDDRFSKKWERHAALPDDRIATLRKFHNAGIFTWVSLEPTLDTASSLSIIDATHGFVDLYKVGRANYVPTITNVVDWREYTMQMIERLNTFGKAHYIKKDLQPFLPVGYPNPLRVDQHH